MDPFCTNSFALINRKLPRSGGKSNTRRSGIRLIRGDPTTGKSQGAASPGRFSSDPPDLRPPRPLAFKAWKRAQRAFWSGDETSPARRSSGRISSAKAGVAARCPFRLHSAWPIAARWAAAMRSRPSTDISSVCAVDGPLSGPERLRRPWGRACVPAPLIARNLRPAELFWARAAFRARAPFGPRITRAPPRRSILAGASEAGGADGEGAAGAAEPPRMDASSASRAAICSFNRTACLSCSKVVLDNE